MTTFTTDRNNRIDRFNEVRQSTRNLLGWAGIAAAATVLAAVTTCARAEDGMEQVALMARVSIEQGGDARDVASADAYAAHTLPQGGWYRVTRKTGHLHVQPAGLPLGDETGLAEAEEIDTLYLRVPGTPLLEGRLPVVKFSSGVLRPKLDHTYALQLGNTPFTLTVQNGLRNNNGVAYGEGAQYTVAYGGEVYTYQLGEHGWDSVIEAVADIDGDGLPDFIVQVGGNGGTSEFLLLSTHARPGHNAPTAELLAQGGC